MSKDEQSDDQNQTIPLLEDVVTTDEVESEYIDFIDDDGEMEDSGVPEYDEELLAMRDDIAKQLEDNLRTLVSEAVKQAIEETTARIGQLLHDELDSTLEHRIRNLIEQRLEIEFGPRHQHASDDEKTDVADDFSDDKS
ncbi:MAG: hypothetical protein KZQ90_19885 [Candidatus Thiodiazotropha sp. (ex Codakia rugifera)]|nr:hypothetical protein [Candidatus Thiodiazotropha sp. (ex Codakia rugifera)]